MEFEAFWLATGEQPFEGIVAGSAECYRLSVRASRAANHRVIRMQRPEAGITADAELVAHFFQFGQGSAALARTCRITLEPRHWAALGALLDVSTFWDLPEQISRGGLDGATYTLEAFQGGRRHRVERWSPDPVASGGELVCVVTDYLDRLGVLAAYRCDLYQRYG